MKHFVRNAFSKRSEQQERTWARASNLVRRGRLESVRTRDRDLLLGSVEHRARHKKTAMVARGTGRLCSRRCLGVVTNLRVGYSDFLVTQRARAAAGRRAGFKAVVRGHGLQDRRERRSALDGGDKQSETLHDCDLGKGQKRCNIKKLLMCRHTVFIYSSAPEQAICVCYVGHRPANAVGIYPNRQVTS